VRGNEASDRGAGRIAPRSAPLTIVSGAVAADDLLSVARAASEALGAPVAIAVPAPGKPVVWPPADDHVESLRPLADAAGAVVTALLRDQNEALRESELLLELARDGASVAGQEETFKLLIGVLLRDRDALEQLHARTISPLATYDAEHDTELLATLQAFLAHHGSTSETAEAMGLHRHTVGYRLARAHEVSGLSPHESDGRERLGLGLKAHQILEADDRIARHQ
jgi:PucR C-terminal helix-turn-helix domain